MPIQRMEHVGIVVDDLAAAIEFFVELGLVLRGEGPSMVAGWTASALLRGCLERARVMHSGFLDPDNGIEIPTKRLGAKDSAKYVYWGEIARAYERGHSLLIYQHFIRESRDKDDSRPHAGRAWGNVASPSSTSSFWNRG